MQNYIFSQEKKIILKIYKKSIYYFLFFFFFILIYLNFKNPQILKGIKKNTSKNYKNLPSRSI